MNIKNMIRMAVLLTGALGVGAVEFVPVNLGTVKIEGPATPYMEKRIARDLPIRQDMTAVKAFRFDLRVSNPADFAAYVCYFKSGNGWYRASLELPDDAVAGGWNRILVTAQDADKVEGTPAGWRNVDAVRIAGYRATTNALSLTLRDIGFVVAKPEAFVIQWDTDEGTRYATIMTQALESLGIEARMVDERDLAPGMLDGAAFVVLPHNPVLSPRTRDVVETFVKGGGRLFGCYGLPAPILTLLGVSASQSYRPSSEKGESLLAGFAKVGEGLPGQPDFAGQASWMCRVATPLAGARTVACWRTADGRTTDMPGLIVSANGVYLSHVWLGMKSAEAESFLAAAVDRLLPGVRARSEARRAAVRAEEARMKAEIRAIPSRSGERRLIWCHSAWGLGGTNDWDSTCRFIRANGFTDLIVNLAWGGCAFYPSRVLPQAEAERGDALAQCRAACRKHGIKMHVWKVCWNLGRATDKSFADAAIAAGRVQRTRSGSFGEKIWNCPSDPHNQQLEIEAMTELALEKDVDGIHFDYIRYPGSEFCFCDGCRRRFEARIGRPVENWAKDTSSAGALAQEWAAFRCANISRVVQEVQARVRAARPRVEISAAVFRDPVRDPFGVGQEWVRWCREGWLDFVCPMDYVKKPKRYAAQIALQREALTQAGSKAKFYPGMAFMCSHFGQPLSPLVVAQEIVAVREAGLEGFTLFSLSRAAENVLPILREGPLSAD